MTFAGYTEKQLRASCGLSDDVHSKVIMSLLDDRDRLRAAIEWVLNAEVLDTASLLRDVLDNDFDVRKVK